MSCFVELRTYQLKPGTREIFQVLMTSESAPLIHAWGMDVVHYGPCTLSPIGYVRTRAYESLEDLGQSQEAFYASRPWREGPREAILACIELTTSLVLKLEDRAVQALRSADGRSPLGLHK